MKKKPVAAMGLLMFVLTNMAHASLEDGLVAYYQFDGNVNDSSPYSNNGNPIGNPLLTTDHFKTKTVPTALMGSMII